MGIGRGRCGGKPTVIRTTKSVSYRGGAETQSKAVFESFNSGPQLLYPLPWKSGAFSLPRRAVAPALRCKTNGLQPRCPHGKTNSGIALAGLACLSQARLRTIVAVPING